MNVHIKTAKKGPIQKNYCVYIKEHMKLMNVINVTRFTHLILLGDTWIIVEVKKNTNALVVKHIAIKMTCTNTRKIVLPINLAMQKLL